MALDGVLFPSTRTSEKFLKYQEHHLGFVLRELNGDFLLNSFCLHQTID